MLSPTAPPLPGGTLLGTGVESSQSQVVPTWEEVPEWNPHPHPHPHPQEGSPFRLTFFTALTITKADSGPDGLHGICLTAPNLLFAYR